MRHSLVLLVGLGLGLTSSVIGSYDGIGATHGRHDHDDLYDYAAPPTVHAPPVVHGHSAGSYYHYHVPVVGQQQQQQPHYPPYYHPPQQDNHNILWPLLLLLALAPLLLLPLLPLLLLPIGISLLALLGGGGMMMMMMMMMMMGEEMRIRKDVGRGLVDDVVFNNDLASSLFTKFARSVDLDQCPHRLACELGSIFLPNNSSTDTGGPARGFVTLLMDQYIPKGRARRALNQIGKAFWSGAYNGDKCGEAFQCQPSFRLYHHQNPEKELPRGNISSGSSHFNESQAVVGNNEGDNELEGSAQIGPKKLKFKRSHYNRNGIWAKAITTEQSKKIFPNSDKYFGQVFGTPTVKS